MRRLNKTYFLSEEPTTPFNPTIGLTLTSYTPFSKEVFVVIKLKDGRIIYTYRKQCKNFDILKDIARKTKRRESFVFAR